MEKEKRKAMGTRMDRAGKNRASENLGRKWKNRACQPSEPPEGNLTVEGMNLN